MSRIIFPTNFTNQIKLLEDIKAKHDADLPNSILQPYLDFKQINLASLIAKANEANSFNNSQSTNYKQSENNYQLGNIAFATAIKNLKSEVQFLKKLYQPNTKELGKWGIFVIGNSEIKYPKNFDKLAAIAILFFDKHLSYPNNQSPLQPFILQQNINVAADKAAVVQATQLKNQAFNQTKTASDNTQQRNQIWQPVVKTMKDIGGYLKNIYTNNPNALGSYGFVVEAEKNTSKMIVTKVMLQQKKTIKNVIIGGILTNIGSVKVKIYQGKAEKEHFVELQPQESMIIPTGHSILTIVNENSDEEAVISAQRSV